MAWLEAQPNRFGEQEAQWRNNLVIDADAWAQGQDVGYLMDVSEQDPSWLVLLDSLWNELVYVVDLDH